MHPSHTSLDDYPEFRWNTQPRTIKECRRPSAPMPQYQHPSRGGLLRALYDAKVTIFVSVGLIMLALMLLVPWP
jgi:hypothetical protein